MDLGEDVAPNLNTNKWEVHFLFILLVYTQALEHLAEFSLDKLNQFYICNYPDVFII